MKGYRLGTGKKKVIYIYSNVITEKEKEEVNYFVNNMGYKPELKIKDVKAIKKRAKEVGFINPLSAATKAVILAWIDENVEDTDEKEELKKTFETKANGGLGFAKAKNDFVKRFPNLEVEKNKKGDVVAIVGDYTPKAE